jgi:hypothetical protein
MKLGTTWIKEKEWLQIEGFVKVELYKKGEIK